MGSTIEQGKQATVAYDSDAAQAIAVGMDEFEATAWSMLVDLTEAFEVVYGCSYTDLPPTVRAPLAQLRIHLLGAPTARALNAVRQENKTDPVVRSPR